MPGFMKELMQTVVTRAGAADTGTLAPRPDELSREVFGVLGVPIDALGLTASLRTLEAAIARGRPFLFSTPNVNFLVSSKAERQFRESLLLSDLCPVDGMPIVWIARLLGVPIKDRVSGADLFDALKLADGLERPLTVFLFGGADEIASQVGRALNARPRGLKCVGALNPGFGTVDEMSNDAIIRAINDSGADILAVFLNARKAQAWLLHNHDRLQIPVRAQFGATINFQAGVIKRAPSFLRSAGFEWLWRIKEEPYLWRRYWADGKSLVHLFLRCALPIAVDAAWARLRGAGQAEGLRLTLNEDDFAVTVGLSGFAVSRHVDDAISRFREALACQKPIVVGLGATRLIDPRFFGLLLMVRKQLRNRGQALRFANLSPRLARAFRLNGFEYLLTGDA